jgi:hypothetical protein
MKTQEPSLYAKISRNLYQISQSSPKNEIRKKRGDIRFPTFPLVSEHNKSEENNSKSLKEIENKLLELSDYIKSLQPNK